MMRSPRWVLERIIGTSIFHLRRTAVPFTSLDETVADKQDFDRALGRVDRARLVLLFDVRDAPLRNDQFLDGQVPGLLQALGRFRRVAVLVKTPVGKLQVSRLSEEAGVPVHVFNSEAAAREFLTADD
jgi:hypothetical protein